MAETWFTPKEWKARLVEFAGRRLLRNVANGESTTYDVSRSEGQVSQEGDAFNTKNMNDLEQRISNGFAKAKTNIDSLDRDLSAVPEFVIDKSTGKITGYKTKAGADTVFPFSAPLLNMKFSQMPKVNYYTSTNLVFENPGYNRLKVTDCNANYWWVYNSPNFDVNNWGNELDTKYQIGNRNDTVFDITNVKYVLIHTKQSENNNSGFGGCKFNLCNE